ncbi:15019_t:CDS:2 [Rhizophagus irregularis]|nr:15019_t:CDS:2 [Rhizophagus irregularis]
MSKRIKRASENAQQREKRLSIYRDAARSQVVGDHCLPESDRKLLHNFRSKIDKLSNNLCPDVQEFATHLPHCPSSLDALVTFKDFNVRRFVVSCALYWLKNNNRYYPNIDIDEEILGSLPENGPLDDQIPRLEDIGDEMCGEMRGEMRGEIDGEIDERAVADTLVRLQSDTDPVMWPRIDGVPSYGRPYRTSRQFWFRRQFELSDMIKQLRDAIFYFSAADFHWPDLHALMPHGHSLDMDMLTVQDTNKYKQKDLIDNPHIAAWYFEKRFKLLFEKVKDAPVIDWSKMKEDEELMNNVIQYLDSLVITINPGLNVPFPNAIQVPKSCSTYRIMSNYFSILN